MIPLIIGAALGAVKQLQEEKQAKRDREMNAEITRMSPWTHMQPDLSKGKDPSAIMNVGQGALAGYSMGAGGAGGGAGVGRAAKVDTGGLGLTKGVETAGPDMGAMGPNAMGGSAAGQSMIPGASLKMAALLQQQQMGQQGMPGMPSAWPYVVG